MQVRTARFCMNSVLAIAPVTRGFGFVVLDSARRPIDWGVKDVRRNGNGGFMSKAMEIMDAHQPTVLAIEDWCDRGARRKLRTRTFLRRLGHATTARGIVVERFSRIQIRDAFASYNVKTVHDVAIAVARIIPEFRPLLPRPRRPWQSEPYRQSIFQAAALAVASLALRERDTRR